MLNDLFLFIAYFAVLLLIALPLGKYMTKVFSPQKTLLDPFFTPIENAIYRLAKLDSAIEMNWREYAKNLILLNLLGVLFVYLIQVFQDMLPLNPQEIGAVEPWHVALNTAVSFVTNTNWQAYAGENTMSYFTQMAAFTVQNFLSAATGLAVAIALIRGLTRKTAGTIGNFWFDLVRSTIRILLPISLIIFIFLVQQGVPQTLEPSVNVAALEGTQQTITLGPVASQEAIKMLGTNGGGFFNANSAHPFENPTPFTNFVEMLSIFLIPVGLLFTYGNMVQNKRQGWAILGSMLFIFTLLLAVLYVSELNGNPMLESLGINQPTAYEGKEVRFGIASSALFASITTAASCGAVNAMHDSLTPLSGLVPMLQMMLGEVVVGGVGAGFYGMMMFVFMTVFIIGLMVGRTPEYLGKKIEAHEIQMATLAILIPSVVILLGSALAAVTEAGTSGIANPGPHGLSEILYAFSSAAGNNGSAFGGLTVNTTFYDLILAGAMLLGRFGVIIPVLAIAGSMSGKKITPPSPGTFATDNLLFTLMLTSVVLIVGALTFLPALALGPIVEHLLMLNGSSF